MIAIESDGPRMRGEDRKEDVRIVMIRQNKEKENKKIVFSIILFLIIVDLSLLAWRLLPYPLSAIGWEEFWPRYSVGFAFSILIGGAMIGRLVSQMQREISYYIHRAHSYSSVNRIRPFVWFPAVFGCIERSIYTASCLLGWPEFIGVWLIVKTAARWALPRTEEDKITDSRHRYYPVLVGSLLNVVYGVAGALVIQWLDGSSGFRNAFAIMLILVVGTLSLTLYESYKYNKWMQDKETSKP